MIGNSASRAASKVKRSTENVFSAPTDLRTRLARTGRSSTPRDPIVKGSRLAKVLLKERHRLRFQIETGFNPELVHLRRGRRTDAVEFADWQIFDKGRSHLWRNDEEAVGLSVIRSELCRKFVVGNPGGCREARFRTYLCPYFHCDFCCRRNPFQILGDVKIGLIQGQRLDDMRVFGKDFADLTRHRLVDIEARLDEDQIGTSPFRRDRWHGGANTKFPRFVAPPPRHRVRANRRLPPAYPAAPDC